MRKITAFAVLFTFVFGSLTPILAQRTDTGKSEGRTIRVNQFDTVRAISDGAGVLVRWQMRSEKNVSAYSVYRIGDGSKDLVSTRVVPGSAARFGYDQVYGEVYNFFDIDGVPGMAYTVQGLTRDGEIFSSTDVTAVAVKSVEAEAGISSEVFATAAASTNSNVERNAATVSGDLLDLVSLYAQEPNPEMQRIIASKPGAKIAVKRDGFYRVTATELVTANFPINSDSTKWRLFVDGNEQAITIGPSNSYIEFYGKGVDTPETDTRFYYLISDTVTGKRIGTKVLRQIPGAAASVRYEVKAGKKERLFYDQNVQNYEEENFFGTFFSTTPARIIFNLTAVDLDSSAKIRVTFFGFTENQHRINVKINGNALPDATQFGRVSLWTEATIPGSHLREGSNEIEMNTLSINDQILFDKVEVTYQRKYAADQSKISFSTPGSKKVDLTGFSTSDVRVFDLTFDGNPVRIANVPVTTDGSSYTATVPSGRTMVGYALEDAGLLQSPAIIENRPSSLGATTNGAQMVIISHSAPSFLNEANAWKTYRESEAGGRITTQVIDIADVYDEFSYGRVSYQAVRDFLEYAKDEWATAPKYVLFMGDSTYDPRNYEGFGSNYLVPSYPVRLILEESFSDEAMADFNDDGLSELSIGRIPARTASRITTSLAKVRFFEQNQLNLSNGALFAYDNALDFDFEGMSQVLANKLPASTPRSFVGAGQPDSQTTLVSRMNEGNVIINYAGHGSAGLWSSSNFFTNASVPSLTNNTDPSFYVMLTCLNGYFVRTNADSLGETLLFHEQGGASGVWASTSKTTPDVQLIMAERFFELLAMNPRPPELQRVGDMIKEAKTAITFGADVRLSWVLLGDPAMKMP